MELLLIYVAFGGIALLAAMSPGPDFLVVSKNSVAHSRRVGLFTAFGVGAGNCVHVAYTIVGIGVLISQSIVVFSVVKFAGASYLIYLGVQMMTSKSKQQVALDSTEAAMTLFSAFRQGFLTSVLNPKVTLFFLSVFSQFVSPELSLAARSLFGIEAVLVVGAWFMVLAWILTYPVIRRGVQRVQENVLKLMGAGLLLLGAKVGLSEQ